MILPYFLTTFHLYSYFNLPDYITLSISNGATIIQSRLNQNPLSIAISRDLDDCIKRILKLIKSQIEHNPYALGFLDSNTLIQMNKTSHPSLPKFYYLIFRAMHSEKHPKFISYNMSLPLYAHSKSMIPSQTQFFTDKNIKDVGLPIVFMSSVIKINLERGSSGSIELLQSIRNCANIEIFETPFIKAYLNDKWNRLKWFKWVQFFVYILYLTFVCIYILHFYMDQQFIIIPITTSVLLSLYEVYRIVVTRMDYLKDPWNYIGTTRAFLFFIYGFQRVAAPKNNKHSPKPEKIDDLLLMLTIFSFLQGFAYFRLFESTRYFSHLIYQVILDSRAFTLVLFYDIFALGFVIYIVFEFENDFPTSLATSFQMSMDQLDPSYYNNTQ